MEPLKVIAPSDGAYIVNVPGQEPRVVVAKAGDVLLDLVPGSSARSLLPDESPVEPEK